LILAYEKLELWKVTYLFVSIYSKHLVHIARYYAGFRARCKHVCETIYTFQCLAIEWRKLNFVYKIMNFLKEKLHIVNWEVEITGTDVKNQRGRLKSWTLVHFLTMDISYKFSGLWLPHLESKKFGFQEFEFSVGPIGYFCHSDWCWGSLTLQRLRKWCVERKDLWIWSWRITKVSSGRGGRDWF
jgi:hypothetical protein